MSLPTPGFCRIAIDCWTHLWQAVAKLDIAHEGRLAPQLLQIIHVVCCYGRQHNWRLGRGLLLLLLGRMPAAAGSQRRRALLAALLLPRRPCVLAAVSVGLLRLRLAGPGLLQQQERRRRRVTHTLSLAAAAAMRQVCVQLALPRLMTSKVWRLHPLSKPLDIAE